MMKCLLIDVSISHVVYKLDSINPVWNYDSNSTPTFLIRVKPSLFSVLLL